MLTRFLAVTSLAGLISSAAAVKFQISGVNSQLCIRMIKSNYNQIWCWAGPKLGTCVSWNTIIKSGRECSPDGAFCWDLFDNGWMEITESAIIYTIGDGVFKNPVSGSVDCNYDT
ncbi:hypothetical protein BGZ65_008076, partial [Modicella reniformis]